MKKIDERLKLKEEWRNNEELSTRLFSQDVDGVKKLHRLKMNDKRNNLFHLSSFSGLINDPNGLTKQNDNFHIFYQWSPYLPIHKQKHWGHFVTKDFINYNHVGMAIEPSLKEDKDGIFSGGGITVEGRTYVFWTGNIKPFGSDDSKRSSYTLVGEVINNKVVNKKSLFEVDKSVYTGHFRDPKPFFRDNKYFLLHGAQTKEMKGTLSVYESTKVDSDYQLKGSLKIKPAIENEGFMWECPDYIKIGNQEFLVISPQGKSFYEDKNQNRDTVIFVPGKLDIENLVFERNGEPQIIDEGFDFYAPQTFSNTKRQLLIGWAGIGEADPYATFDYMWAHNLTLTRELTVDKNGKVNQWPIEEYKNLRISQSELESRTSLDKSRLFEFELFSDGELDFELVNNESEKISFVFKGNSFTVSRENMSFDQAPNFGRTRTRKINQLENLRVYIDNSLVEVYINYGETVFTTKYFVDGNLTLNIKGKFEGKGYELKPFEVEWNV